MRKMSKESKLLAFITLLTLTGCDPGDDRMVFINNDLHSMHVSMVFFREGIEAEFVHSRAGSRIISAHDTQRIGMTTFWESEFKSAKPDSLLRVIVIPESKLQDPESYELWRSIIDSGSYFLRSYSYKELKRKEWTIVFPDDGFEVKKRE